MGMKSGLSENPPNPDFVFQARKSGFSDLKIFNL